MDKDKAFKLIMAVIAGTRHTYYDRTVELANLYRTLITGDGMDKMLHQFVRRESKEDFDQRKQLTQHIITSVAKNLMDVAFKVPRSTSKSRILKYTTDDNNKTKELEDILSRFWGDKTLDDYMDTRFIELQYNDPNSFIVTEFKAFDNEKEKASPYPFEVNSANALDYSFDNNILEYLICDKSIKFPKSGGLVGTGSRFTMYLPEVSFYFEERDIELYSIVKDQKENTVFAIGDENFVIVKKKLYQIYEPEGHQEPVVPAIRVGYARDQFSKGHIFESPFTAAIPYMKKSIKANSEMDLTAALVAFPQKIQYLQPCDAPGCLGGKLANGDPCQACKGTGVKGLSTSVQDAVTAPMPQVKEDFIPLDSLIKYVSPDVSILKWQQEYIDSLTAKCKSVVFNTGIFDNAEVAQTATGKNIDLQNVYDILYPLSIEYSKVWMFQVGRCSGITDMKEGLVSSMSFGKDFKMKTKDDYINDRKTAKEAGVSSHILREFDNEIMRLSLIDNPSEFRRYMVQQTFNPFSGKTPEEIAIIMVQNKVPEKYKILYQNMEIIFDEIAFETKNFYDLKRDKQKGIVMKKVDEFVAMLTPEGPVLITQKAGE